MTLTKAEMAERLFLDVGLNKREAKECVDAFFEVLREARERGEQVKLSGFGNFDLRDKNQRPGRNPKTGEEIPISARRVVTFRPGQKLKLRVESNAGPGQQLRTPRDPRQALLHHRRGERTVRGQAARAALLGTGVPGAEAREAARQPALLPASRRADDPADPRAALRPGFHHHRRARAAGRPAGQDGGIHLAPDRAPDAAGTGTAAADPARTDPQGLNPSDFPATGVAGADRLSCMVTKRSGRSAAW